MGTLGIYSLISTANQGDVSYNSPCKSGRIRAPPNCLSLSLELGRANQLFWLACGKDFGPRKRIENSVDESSPLCVPDPRNRRAGRSLALCVFKSPISWVLLFVLR